MQENNQVRTLNLKDFLLFALQKWHLLLIITAACMICSAVYSFFFITPLYNSTGEIYILNKKSDTISSSDLSISSYLTRDYEYLIVDRAVLDVVSQRLNGKYSVAALKRSITVENPENTRFLQITVSSPSATDSKKIVDTICEVSQEKITELLGIDSVNIIYRGTVAKAPSSPNISQNIIRAAAVGVVLFAVIVFAVYALNDKIDSAEDVENELGLTVIGNIPYNQAKSPRKAAGR